MKKLISFFSLALFTLAQTTLYAEDKIELETTTIKGNKELPKILFVVPWQDIKNSKKEEQQIRLHSLFGDLFDPVTPENTTH